MTARRTLPLRVEPWPGESVQSWVEQLAYVYEMPVAQMGERLGLRPAPPHEWSLRLDAQEAASAAAVAGVEVETLHLMTVAGWTAQWTDDPGVGLYPDSESKNCNRCLIDNGGRWLLAWRLPLHQVCRRHQVVLQRGCGWCGRGLVENARMNRPPVHWRPVARRCVNRCRQWAPDVTPRTTAVPHGSVWDAGAAFLDAAAAMRREDRVTAATGALVRGSDLYREASLLAERMRPELHDHDLLDASRSGQWEPARACGRPIPWSRDRAVLHSWALAGQVLLADGFEEAVASVQWLAGRERRLDRFPRSEHEHQQMPQRLGPVLAPVMEEAVRSVTHACPDTHCEPGSRLYRLQRGSAHWPGGLAGPVDFGNLDDVLWQEALEGWQWALREGIAAT